MNGRYAVGAIVLVVMLVCILFITRTTTPSITNYPATGTGPIVAFGDSLVAGVGADASDGFVSMVSEQIGEPIINQGVSGDTTRDAVNRLDEVLVTEPRLVILLLGGNDYLQQVPSQETFENLEQIITEVQAGGAVVVLLGVRGGLLYDEYKDRFAQLAEDTGAAYVPNVLSGLIGDPSLMSDVIHPNDQGYKIIADKVSPVVVNVLN